MIDLLLDFAVIVFVAYTIAVIIKNKGIPISYSRTHYLWKPLPLMLITWAIIGIAIYTKSQTILTALAAIALFVVGIAANYLFGDSKHDKLEYWAHMIGSYTTAILALVSMVYDHKQYLISVGVALFYILFQFKIIKIKNETFWCEFVGFASYFLVLYLK